MTMSKESLLYNILPFGIIWFVFAIVYVILEKGILGDLGYYPTTTNHYSFTRNLMVVPILAFLTGLLMGSLEKRYIQKLFEGRIFRIKIIVKSLFYIVIIVSFLSITSALTSSLEFQIPFFSTEAWRSAGSFFTSFSFIGLSLYIAVMVVVSLFYVEISKTVNKNMINNFFTGTYSEPITEEGIFMFVDMKSSTTHAEKLGHELYFKMLQEYYKDLSIAIVRFKGDIYQYAGDQVIVTWTLNRGLKDKRCIKCLLYMRKIFQRNKEKYLQKYGVFPEFKAGIHTGLVTTGEIGDVKKEILFTGDVLNSTARIQDLCREYNVDNLLSKELLNKLELVNSSKFRRIGEVKLKGKKLPTELYTII